MAVDPELTVCCDETHGDGCGRAADGPQTADALTGPAAQLRETVREKYAAAARAAGRGGGCCSSGDTERAFGAPLYTDADEAGVSAAAVQASLGCGVPTAVADLHDGETVLDLGSGAGADVLISARRVGPTGRAIGIDMTDEMLELARRNADEAGLRNVEFIKGYLENLPLPDASVDVVISNCVINLSGDKPRVLAEAARVLKPGGRFAVSDVIADPDIDDARKADMAAWTGCIAGALTEREFRDALAAAGLVEPEFRETHRVHEHAGAAIIRARKPLGHPLRLVVPQCSLPAAEIEPQLDRYRQLAGHVVGVEQALGEVRVQFDETVPGDLLESTLAIERGCCSFMDLDYASDSRLLRITVANPEQDAALDSLATLLTRAD